MGRIDRFPDPILVDPPLDESTNLTPRPTRPPDQPTRFTDPIYGPDLRTRLYTFLQVYTGLYCVILIMDAGWIRGAGLGQRGVVGGAGLGQGWSHPHPPGYPPPPPPYSRCRLPDCTHGARVLKGYVGLGK